MKRWASLLLSVGLSCATPLAHAGEVLRPNDELIDTSNYTLDLYEGPVLAGSRVVALGGAYAGIAEGIAGYRYNPAAVAQRVPWSTTWFDWEVDGGFTLPGSVTDFDFDNNGRDGFPNSAAFFGTAGLGLQFGDLGIGLSFDLQLYQLDNISNDRVLNVTLLRPLLVAGYSFLDGEILVGVGASSSNVGISLARAFGDSLEENAEVAGTNGISLHGGALWAPAYVPLRVGASVRWSPKTQADKQPTCTPPRCREVDGQFVIVDPGPFDNTTDQAAYLADPNNRLYIPRGITLPTEIQLGAALQLFRPFNVPWVNPHEEDSAQRRVEQRVERDRERAVKALEARIEAEKAAGRDAERYERQREQYEEASDKTETALVTEAKAQDRARRLMPYKAMPRGKLLISGGAKITLPVEDGVGMDSFLEQRVERSGEKVTLQPNLGLEGEVWPGYLVLRGGSYLEPSRFENGSSRLHGTAGLDVRIPIEWSVFGIFDDDNTFRVGGAIDYTVRYFGWGVSVGIWR